MHEVTKLFKIHSGDMEMTQELKFEHSLDEIISDNIVLALEKCGRGGQIVKGEYDQPAIPAFEISFDIIELIIGGKKTDVKQYSSDVFPNKMVAITFLRNIVKAIFDFASLNEEACFLFVGAAQETEDILDDVTRKTRTYSMMLRRAFKKSSGWISVAFGEDYPNDIFFFRCNDDNASSQNEIYSLIDEEFSSMK